MMRAAHFTRVFLGIETPVAESLQETTKFQNLRKDLLESVRLIQSYGMEVMAGFIVGFDNDPPDVFDRQIEFIRQAAIPLSMVGLLTGHTQHSTLAPAQGGGPAVETQLGKQHRLRFELCPTDGFPGPSRRISSNSSNHLQPTRIFPARFGVPCATRQWIAFAPGVLRRDGAWALALAARTVQQLPPGVLEIPRAVGAATSPPLQQGRNPGNNGASFLRAYRCNRSELGELAQPIF